MSLPMGRRAFVGAGAATLWGRGAVAGQPLVFDPAVVPFSYAGSYLAVTRLTAAVWGGSGYAGPRALALRLLRGDPQVAWGAVLHLVPDGEYAASATPDALTLAGAGGRIVMRFLDRLTVRVEGDGLGLSLVPPPGEVRESVAEEASGRWFWNAPLLGGALRVTRQGGTLVADGPARLVASGVASGTRWSFDIAEVEWRTGPPPAALPAFSAFLDAMPAMPSAYEAARALAAYACWSGLVAPGRMIRRPALYASKNWMFGVWSWDHAFNAVALTRGLPGLAWDQMLVPFDAQTRDGQVPDRITDRGLIYNFVKPPIHGWALGQMMGRGAVPGARLADFYPRLAAVTRWWLSPANAAPSGLPFYRDGNDSGWDNATLFEAGVPIEAPDLAALLVLQTEMLGRVARRLGRATEAAEWAARSQALLALLVRELWRGDRFVARRVSDGAVHDTSDSLIAIIPLVLGMRLPEAVRKRLVAALATEGRFLTRFGLASEALSSPEYEPDGYWRGPVWGAPNLMLVDALWACGERALAQTIAQRFCGACREAGFPEHIDARTGAALRDPAVSWTAACFLALGRYL